MPPFMNYKPVFPKDSGYFQYIKNILTIFKTDLIMYPFASISSNSTTITVTALKMSITFNFHFFQTLPPKIPRLTHLLNHPNAIAHAPYLHYS